MVDRTLNYGRHIIQDFLGMANNPKVILDLGAGQGDDLKIAQSIHPKSILHAIDCSESNIQVLTSNNITAHKLNIENELYPMPDESVDVIIANQILEHTKEIFWIFHEVSRILSQGGHFIIGVPNLASLHNRTLLAVGKQPTVIKNNCAHIRGFTKGDINDLAQSGFPGGYKLVAFRGSNFYPFSPLISRPLAELFPSMAWGIFLLFQKQKAYNGEFLTYPIINKLETNFYLGK